jgi:hypothetical protein
LYQSLTQTAPRQDAWAAGAPFADGKSVEIDRLDKPEAIHRLPSSGGGGRGLMGRKKAIDGGERGLPNNPAAKRLNNYTPALKRTEHNLSSVATHGQPK